MTWADFTHYWFLCSVGWIIGHYIGVIQREVKLRRVFRELDIERKIDNSHRDP